MTTATDIAERLRLQLEVTSSGCWEFARGRTGGGYGAFYVGNGRCKGAHVVAYEVWKGPVSKGMFVCHTCDNPPCCNPNHLFLGTAQDNKDDEVCKERHIRGSRNNTSKLSENNVEYIKQLLNSGESPAKIARQFNVHRNSIYYIRDGKNWSWLQ